MTQPIAPVTVENAPRRSRGCLLVGCMVLVLLLAVPLAALWAVINAASHAGPAQPRHADLTHPLPAGPGRVVVNLAMANVDIVAAPAGSPLRLQADWDERAFHLRESLHQDAGGEGWTYEVSLRGRGLRFLHFHTDANAENRVRLYLPAGHPLALSGKLAMGQSDLALGGLALQSVDLDLAMGEHRVSFAEPTTLPLERLRLHGRMGELTVLRAGNASPRVVDVQHAMGDLTLDLAGAWHNDSDVSVRIGMGDGQVQLPAVEEAHAEVEEAHMALGDGQVHERRQTGVPVPPGLPHVRIRAHGGMGDLEIR